MTLQTINVGAAPNDRTGDPWRDAIIKVIDNLELIYSNPLTNVVNINSLADFPAPVAGVIELVQTPGVAITYVISAQEIDVSPNVFTITGGDVAIMGSHRSESGLTTAASGTMFTVANGSFFQDLVGFACPNAKWVDFSNSLGGFKSLVGNGVVISDCDSLGTIAGAYATIFQFLTVADSQTSGFTWTGTTNRQINITDFIGIGWTGTLFDLGTATFDIINMSGDCRFTAASGTTTLSGLASSGNLKAGGRAKIDACLFEGAGTALNNIDTMDLQWEFTGNIFEDGVTHNTRTLADCFLTTLETVTIASSGVYVAVAGSSWDFDNDERFTVSTAGLITYLGLDNAQVSITAQSTVAKVGGGSDQIGSKIAYNGTVQDKTIGSTENTSPTGLLSQGLFTLSTGDTLQLFVGNEDSSSNIEVSSSSIIVSALP